MSSWGERRRNTVVSIFMLIVLVCIIVFLFVYLDKDPTCFDGKRNQDETGVDCGGPCSLFCEGTTVPPLIHWSRHFEVVPGAYNVVAYVENLNSNAGTDRADYVFKLYDDKNVVLTERKGTTKIGPRQIIPITENILNTGQLRAVRSSFEFTNNIIWRKSNPQNALLEISNERFFELNNTPRISANITNVSLNRINRISLVAIVYDLNGNALASSSTLVDSIDKNQTMNIIFAWPQKFSKSHGRFEIIPVYEPGI